MKKPSEGAYAPCGGGWQGKSDPVGRGSPRPQCRWGEPSAKCCAIALQPAAVCLLIEQMIFFSRISEVPEKRADFIT